MAQHPITITCLAYNSLKTIREAILSAWNQDYVGVVTILVREHAGNAEEIAVLNTLAQTLGSSHNRRIVVTPGENLGFAGGHNLLFRESKDPFVLALNPDAILVPSYLTEAMPAFEDNGVGAVQGKLLRLNLETMRSPVVKGNPPAPIIDTTGLVPLRNRRIINRGQGEEDRGQYDEGGEVWGPDGAAPIYRKRALEDIAIPIKKNDESIAEYFDEDFFAYKEDVDLAWRLRWRNWKTLYVPSAVAWHGRGSGESASKKYHEIIAERRKISSLSKYYSFANQRLLLLKNEDKKRYLNDIPHWFIKEVGAWGYALLFERRTIPAIARVIKLLSTTLRKRRYIMSHRAPSADPYIFFE